MTELHSYSSIFTLGHRGMRDLFDTPVFVEEKIDGSQFSFGNQGGKLLCRSKGQNIDPECPPKMFARAVATAKRLMAEGKLPDGWVFRGECLDKPRHNVLAYERVPAGNVIIYDLETGPYEFAPYSIKHDYVTNTLGLECSPCLWKGDLKNLNSAELLKLTSVLGGQLIEGYVIKPQSLNVWGEDKKLVMAKVVSEKFKETAHSVWARGGEFKNHLPKDIIVQLGDHYRTEARWNKAIQHLREENKLSDVPQDIPLLITEVPDDILKECEEEIKDKLFKWAMKDLRKSWTRGLPEYYKKELASRMQAEVNEDEKSTE